MNSGDPKIKTPEEVLSSLKWSEPREVQTKAGPRIVSSAPATDEVFTLWREGSESLRKLGYSIGQFRGAWQLSRWQKLPEVAQKAREEALAASRATDADVQVPLPDGLALLPYQRAGIAFALKREAVLFGDEMGLGKTIQAIGVLNSTPDAKRILVICPASLKLNWRNELRKWCVVKRPIYVVDSQTGWPREDGIAVVNYDVLHKYEAEIKAVEWDVLIADEAHYLKTPTARRTKMVFGVKAKKDGTGGRPAIRAKRRLLLTGTPIANRPVELFPLASYLYPKGFDNFFKYALRYCAAHRNGFGWDFSGASNLDELQDRLRASIMVRRLKKDVLTELPAKRRQVIEIPADGQLAHLVNAERDEYESYEDRIIDLQAAVEIAKASEDPDEHKRAVEALKEGMQAAFGAISSLRRQLGEAKADLCIEHLKGAVEESGKVVAFAHHKALVAKIVEAFGPEAVVLVGDTKMEDRQTAVERFQSDPSVKLFVGSIGAAGVGITLTASSHVVFCELDWVPGNVSQAEDRCHRIGQKNSVLVQHLVVEGSLDATMAKRIVEKQDVIDRALDSARLAVEVAVPAERSGRQGATVGTPADKLAKEADLMTADQREASIQALRLLASRCNGARDWDGMGFSKLDTTIGKDLASRPFLTKRQCALARKICRKYRNTQLPAELVERMGE